MTGRYFPRLTLAATAAALVFGIGLSAQQTPPAPQAPPAAVAQGPAAAEKYKNIQVLKMPADQLLNSMEYITASLGVQCRFCHVMTPEGVWQFEKDDSKNKVTARKMIQMVEKINGSGYEITLACASCHHGRNQPERTPPLALQMTTDQAAAAARQREATPQRGGQPGAPPGPGAAPGQGAPPPPGAAGAPPPPGAAGAPPPPGAAGAPPAPGPGGAPQGRGGPPRPSETIDQVVDKYVEALGGQAAIAQAKTRVMQGTATSRDLQANPITVKEKVSGEYRVDLDTKPAPTIRVSTGKGAWVQAFGNVHDLEGIPGAQVARLTDFGLPLNLKQRYTNLAVGRYGNIDGAETIIVSGRPTPDVTEQLQFDRKTGLLLRRTIQTRTPLGILVEQADYSDYRAVTGGPKTPFEVRYTTWNQMTTEKFTDVKINAPVDDALFAKPAGR